MKMLIKKKPMTVGLILLSVLMFLTALATRLSLVNDLSPRIYIDNDAYLINSIPDVNQNFLTVATENPLDLERQSDVVVRVTVRSENERYFHSGQTVTRADVLETYKGDVGETIYILEPIVFYSDFILTQEGYYWMRDEEEYIVFLRQCEDMHIGKDKYIYIPTFAGYSQYCVTRDYPVCNVEAGPQMNQQKYRRIRERVLADR